MAATTAELCSPGFSGRPPEMNARRLLTWLGLLSGIGGLVLQFVLSLQGAIAAGRDFPGFLGHFFAFYTILTNAILVLVYLSELAPSADRLALFRLPVIRGLMAANIALVSLYVFFVLRYLSVLTGLLQLADTILHYVCPVLYLLWWAAQPHGRLRWANLPLMLLPTLVYFVYVMARGVWVQEYPYPFMNAIKVGYGQVLFGALQMTVGLTVLTAAVIAIDHILSRNWNVVHD